MQVVDSTGSGAMPTRTVTTLFSASRCGGRDGGNAERTSRQRGESSLIEVGDDDTTGRWGGAPPAYMELSSHFASLQSAVEACGNGDASSDL